MIKVKRRETCRICGCHDMRKVINFPECPLVEDFRTKKDVGGEFLYPLTIYVCERCKQIQTLHDVDVSGYYKGFIYSVASSPFARQFMKNLAGSLFERYNLKKGASVLEIGSGDGFQLSCFQDIGARVYGIEPSKPLVDISLERGVPVIQALFSNDVLDRIPKELFPFQVVLLTYTFDHLTDPLSFLVSIRDFIDQKKGLLVLEVHDLPKIMERREYCLFGHEHPCYFSVDTIRNVLVEGGFELVDCELLPESQRRGNSLLVVAKPAADPQKTPKHLIYPKLQRLEAYDAFGHQVENSLYNFRNQVIEDKKIGTTFAGYGAGGRGVLTLAMTGLKSDDIGYLCDKNEKFYGYYTPKSHVPIVPLEHALENMVDKMIVFSYGYMKDISQDMSGFTKSGGILIPLLELL
ncbi:MAG: class I SAM-dependent methyltransferase [Candidatus Altiarchaeota archaeon]